MTGSAPAPASLKVLFITAAGCSALVILYAILGIEPHPFVALVVTLAPLFAAMSWLRADARARRVGLVHDMGLFLWLAWPIIIPWYAVRTRGRHALPLAVLILFLMLVPFLLALVVQLASTLGKSS